MATQKITMGRGRDTDYESKKAAALAQAGMGGDFMWGIQSVYENGTGQASKASRNAKYGNVNITTGDALDGTYGNFKPQFDDAGNQVLADPRNTTGNADAQYSSTIVPQTDSEVIGRGAAERMKMVAQGGQYPGLNNRAQLYRV